MSETWAVRTVTLLILVITGTIFFLGGDDNLGFLLGTIFYGWASVKSILELEELTALTGGKE